MCNKKCRKCDTEKHKSEFGSDSSKKDKLRTVCSACSRDYDKERAKKPKRKAYMKSVIGEYRRSGKAVKSAREYRLRYPKKYKAHKAITSAIRNKSLTKEPCEVCGSDVSYGHHDDYEKLLSVRWLCDKHHRDWHSENGEGLNGS